MSLHDPPSSSSFPSTPLVPSFRLHTSDLPPTNFTAHPTHPSAAILTPRDYSRLYLDPELAITQCNPKIVGVLACQRDPYLRELKTRVVRVRRYEASGRPKAAAGPGVAEANAGVELNEGKAGGKNGKKGKKQQGQSQLQSQQQQTNGHKKDTNSKVDGNGSLASSTSKPAVAIAGSSTENDKADDDSLPLWELEFEDTVLFPEGGGQPCDTGYVSFLTSSSIDDDKVGPAKDDGIPASDSVNDKKKEKKERLKYRVIDVFRRGLTAVHVVQQVASASAAFTPINQVDDGGDAGRGGAAAVAEALGIKEGDEVLLEVDWERRVDHMTLHTAQHLLSALCDTHLSLPTLSWYLPPHPSIEPAYAELPRPLTAEEALDMEQRANELVTLGWGAKRLEEDVRVWIESRVQKKGSSSQAVSGAMTPVAAATTATQTTNAASTDQEQAGLGLAPSDEKNVNVNSGDDMSRIDARLSSVQIDTSGSPAGNLNEDEEREWGDRESRGLPKDYAGGVIRTAVIDGIDRSLCCGTHHPNLSRVGLLHVLPPSLNLTTNKPTRLYLLAGPRAFKSLLTASRDLSTAAGLMACTREIVGERLAQREAQRMTMSRGMTALRAELGKAIGRSVEWETRGGTAGDEAGGGGKQGGAAGSSFDARVASSASNQDQSSTEASKSTSTHSSSVALRLATLSRSDESTHDFEFMNLIHTSAIGRLIELDGNGNGGDPLSKRGGAMPKDGYVLAIVSTLPGQKPIDGNGDAALTLVQITSQPPELAKQLGDRLKALLAQAQEGGDGGEDRVKGGGARGRWMGKISGKWGKKEKMAWEGLFKGMM